MSKNGLIQWGWPDMEELLQCPVCLDIPATGPGQTVEQCIYGHHICYSCKMKVDNCPLCKATFHGTRNFVVEELLRHFEIIKNTMLLSGITEKPKRKRKIKLNAKAEALELNKIPRRRVVNTPKLNKGRYQCRVEDCNVVLPVSRLLNHVRSLHPNHLTESMVDTSDTCTQIWEIPFRNRKPINKISYAVFVTGIGLVFLNLEILRSGQLIVVIQAAMKYQQAQRFLACMEFYSSNATFSYNTTLVSVRDNIPDMLQRKTCFTLSRSQLKRLCVDKKFVCKLKLSSFNEFNYNLLSDVNKDAIAYAAAVRASLIDELKMKAAKKTETFVQNGNPFETKQAESSASTSSHNAVCIEDLLRSISPSLILKNLRIVDGNQSNTVSAKKKNKKQR